MKPNATPARQSLSLEVICIDLPDPAVHPGLHLGLVEGKTVLQSVSLEQAFSNGSVSFRTELEVALDPQKGSAVFYGPAAQGSPADRFIYLAWQKPGQAGMETALRTKLPLSIFPYALVSRAASDRQGLRVQLKLKNKRGQPATGSLKPDALQVS